MIPKKDKAAGGSSVKKQKPKKAEKKPKAEQLSEESKTFGHLTKEQVIEALQFNNGLISLAAKNLGVTPQCIYKWRDKDADVRQTILDARSEIVDAAEHGLRCAVLRGDNWAICFTLKTLGKDRGYVERLEQTGAGGGAIKVEQTPINLSKLSKQELLQLKAIQKKLNNAA